MSIKFSLYLAIFLHGGVSVAGSPTGVASDLDDSLREKPISAAKAAEIVWALRGPRSAEEEYADFVRLDHGMQLHEFFSHQESLPVSRGKNKSVQSLYLSEILVKKAEMTKFKAAGHVVEVGRVEHSNRKIERCLLCGIYQARADMVSEHIRADHSLEWNDFWSFTK